MQVLELWRSYACYRASMWQAAAKMSKAGHRWVLRRRLRHWQSVVEVMQGQRNTELRDLVVLRACLG